MPRNSISSTPPSSEPAEFFGTVQAAYMQAAQTTTQIERWYSIAGHTIRLCFAGPALLQALTPALVHLAIAPPPPDQKPELTLCIWDSLSTQTPRLVAPWTLEQIDLRGEVPAYSNARYLTMTQLDMPAMSILDTQEGLGYFWIAAPEHIFVFERAAPMKVLLHWWLRAQGLPMIHAAGIGIDETGIDETDAEAPKRGAVLIVGKTAAGKSTTSLLCLAAGLRFISDDRCLLEFTKTAPNPKQGSGQSNGNGIVAHAHCIYNSAKLHTDHMQRFPHLLPYLDYSSAPDSRPVHSGPANVQPKHIQSKNAQRENAHVTDEKSLVFVHQFAPGQIANRLPVRALLLARVAHTPETTLTPVGRMAVLRELTTSTLVYQPGAAQAEIQAMAQLVQNVPCYQINLGHDWEQIPRVIRQTIRETI